MTTDTRREVEEKIKELPSSKLMKVDDVADILLDILASLDGEAASQ